MKHKVYEECEYSYSTEKEADEHARIMRRDWRSGEKRKIRENDIRIKYIHRY